MVWLYFPFSRWLHSSRNKLVSGFSSLSMPLNHPKACEHTVFWSYSQSVWFSKSWVGLKNWHFKQISRWCWCCWSQDNLRTTLYPMSPPTLGHGSLHAGCAPGRTSPRRVSTWTLWGLPSEGMSTLGSHVVGVPHQGHHARKASQERLLMIQAFSVFYLCNCISGSQWKTFLYL